MTPKAIQERLTGNDRAVSPVIGVILMVAITVILAAVIGTFVLDLGQSAGQSAPSASLTVQTDTGTDNFTINHKGGDSLNAVDTRVVISNDSERLEWSPASDESSFAVGDSHDFSTDGAAGIDNSWTLEDPASGAFDLASGSQYDVQVIDTESQRVIFETTVTA